jgi:hypothetical protein
MHPDRAPEVMGPPQPASAPVRGTLPPHTLWRDSGSAPREPAGWRTSARMEMHMEFSRPLSAAPSPSLTARISARALLAFGFLLILLPAAYGADTLILPYASSGYRYQVVAWGAGVGFEQPAFDDSGFAVGSAPFGTRTGVCPLYQTVQTHWSVNTDLLLRKSFALPAGAQAVKVGVAIDNDIQIFINGVDISAGYQQSDGCAVRDQFVFPIPDHLLVYGGMNLLALRAHDRGNGCFCDVEVRWGLPQAVHPKALVYNLHSGNNGSGEPDPLVWVQGHDAPVPGARNTGLPLEQAFVVPNQQGWVSVEGAQWVSSARNGSDAPGGYEYFVLFALPPGYQSARLDILWRGDDQAALYVNDRRQPAPWGFFGASSPPGKFDGEIMPYLQPGMNRLQFFTSNAFVGINPAGVSFLATITLSP